MKNKIIQTQYDFEEVTTKLQDIAEFHGIVLRGQMEFYEQVVSAEYFLNKENKLFYPRYIASVAQTKRTRGL